MEEEGVPPRSPVPHAKAGSHGGGLVLYWKKGARCHHSKMGPHLVLSRSLHSHSRPPPPEAWG